MSSPSYKKILKLFWGYDEFRGIQLDIIESICAGHDTLGLMPTGGGKSITFQVPALARRGTCVVVTPLISLMHDQVSRLRQMGIRATAIHSGMSRADIVAELENCILGEYKFLYVSPERLESELFQTKLNHMRVSLITVDEAHCISQWGYDFRPAYLQIAHLRDIVPYAPLLALTATATPEVVDDIQFQLRFRPGSRVLRMSFERKNLTYIVRHTPDKFGELLHILRSIEGCAIVYTRNRQQTHEIAQGLIAEGISATNYHAALAQIIRDDRQERWHRGEFRVMVATNAFGMGIDKADVRLVLHFEAPDSPEAYFQEAGRAGRDGLPAYAVLLCGEGDSAKLLRRIPETYPKPEYVRDIYEHLCYYFQMAMGDGEGVTREFDLMEFCRSFRYFPVPAHNALLLLSRAGYIAYTHEGEITSRLRFTVNRDSLYRLSEQSPQREKVIHFLLRHYSGLFADFIYIDEVLIAHETALSIDEVFLSLKTLAHFRILDYIPRKSTSYITFSSRRLEKQEITLPHSVYKDRIQQYERRIRAIIQYITDDQVCRSQFLLSYFGETAAPCGKCDVCRDGKMTRETRKAIRQSILSQLREGPLFPDRLDHTGFSTRHFAQVAADMLREEEITLDKTQRFTLHKR